jgi:hypothetical protein
MAGLCLILTDQVGCDLLDHKAVDRAVNEAKIMDPSEVRDMGTVEDGTG